MKRSYSKEREIWQPTAAPNCESFHHSMPPKSPQPKQHSQKPTKPQLDAINNYLAQKPDFDRLLQEEKLKPKPISQPHETDYDRQVKQAIRESTSNLSDKINEMKDNLLNSNSNSDSKDESRKVATIQDHQANPGPVMGMSSSMEAPASKEELKKRAEELNK